MPFLECFKGRPSSSHEYASVASKIWFSNFGVFENLIVDNIVMWRQCRKNFSQRLCRKSLLRHLRRISLLRRLRRKNLPRRWCLKSRPRRIGTVRGGNILRRGGKRRRGKYPRRTFSDVAVDIMCGVAVAFHDVVCVFSDVMKNVCSKWHKKVSISHILGLVMLMLNILLRKIIVAKKEIVDLSQN